MTRPFRWSVGWLVCHNFLKGREVTLSDFFFLFRSFLQLVGDLNELKGKTYKVNKWDYRGRQPTIEYNKKKGLENRLRIWTGRHFEIFDDIFTRIFEQGLI